MATFKIATDSDTQTVEAGDAREALQKFGVPDNVQSVGDFVGWLEASGGYGHIEADGVILARVSA